MTPKIPTILDSSLYFPDHRGELIELLSEQAVSNGPLSGLVFPKQNLSISKKGVIRGIHGDKKTAKLVSCVFGSIYLVAVDVEQGRFWEFHLDYRTRGKQVFVPAGFGMGYLVTSRKAGLWYAWTREYNDKKKDGGQFTYRYDDKRFKIPWPLFGKKPILSERDNNG